MEQQTTVEWFVKNVESISNNKSLTKKESIKLYNQAIEQAKEMEEKRMIEFACNVFDINHKRDASFRDTAEQYYKKTFKNKINMENTNTQETNYEIGRRMQREGYGISDSWGSAITTNPNNEPTNEEIEEWVRGYNDEKSKTK
jgi:isocitrate dehydrogenase